MSNPRGRDEWPNCFGCSGTGVEYDETCMTCGGSGRDSECCDRCEERGVGYNEDGDFLCEGCLFEEQCEEMFKVEAGEE